MSIHRPLFCPQLNRAALSDALAIWRGAQAPQGVLALTPEAEREQIPVLREVCVEAGLQLAGAVFPAVVEGSDFHQRGAWLLPHGPDVQVRLVADLPEQPELAAARVAAVIEPLLGASPATLFMIFDAMVPNIGSILDSLYLGLADRVAYAGVNAGSETFQPMPCLFDADRTLGNGLLCLLLPGSRGAAMDHGYLAPKELITATATEGNRIISIEWRPAFEVYQELVGSLYQIGLTRENFYQYAIHFPFGILLANDELVVRIPVALEEDGSLFCVGEVPANSMLTLLRAPEVDTVRSVRRISSMLSKGFGTLGERDLLTFYCAGRRLHLGADAASELARLAGEAGAGRLVGALSLGEIGSISEWGYPLFHNATLVCRPWD